MKKQTVHKRMRWAYLPVCNGLWQVLCWKWKDVTCRACLALQPQGQRGFIPIIVLMVFGAAAFMTLGARIQQRHIQKTMVCHEPGQITWPSMSVPNYDGGGR